ncbi:MAG: SDR family oxidoreductase, partial [Verrucomicrobiota bacterium]|nr:SDR family oxidoreductase [Verrucomicrobiota bacterium]
MKDNPQDKVVLVTGTSRGLGRAIVGHYLELGHVVVGCSRKPSDLVHARYRHYELDVTDESAVVSMIRDLVKTHGRLDVLVNNAGIASMNAFALTPTASVRRILETNVIAPFVMMREAAKIMMRARRGRMVNFTSVAVPLNLEGEAIYAASKAALESLTRTAAREFGQHGITVNAIGPTPIKTDLIRGVPEAKLDALIQRQAIPRYGEIDDVLN